MNISCRIPLKSSDMHSATVPCPVVDQMGDAGKGKESCVPFIHVADLGFAPQSQKRLDAADAQKQLLMETHGLVPAVEPPGDGTQFRGILGDLSVYRLNSNPDKS